MQRPLDEFEKAALEAITEHPGCNVYDLRILLGRLPVGYVLRLLLKKGIVRKKRFPGEHSNRYYALLKHPLGSRLRKGKPALDDDQARILRAVKKTPVLRGGK